MSYSLLALVLAATMYHDEPEIAPPPRAIEPRLRALPFFPNSTAPRNSPRDRLDAPNPFWTESWQSTSITSKDGKIEVCWEYLKIACTATAPRAETRDGFLVLVGTKKDPVILSLTFPEKPLRKITCEQIEIPLRPGIMNFK